MIFATGNAGKMREIRAIWADTGWEIRSMEEAGIEAKIQEDGRTFEENALIKARAVAALCGETVLADDSGLEVDHLNGEPGIYSAKYYRQNGGGTPGEAHCQICMCCGGSAAGRQRDCG